MCWTLRLFLVVLVFLIDMVFQGSVLGPPLWNIFHADFARSVQKKTFTESIFANDLNCFKNFAKVIGREYILRQIQDCQKKVHVWGHANKVSFDFAKKTRVYFRSAAPVWVIL